MSDDRGYPRSYFYRRIAAAMHEIVNRADEEGDQPEMVTKVNLQEAIERLTTCPVCGASLIAYDNYPLERSCACGDFTITEVWSDGDVTFAFKMTAPEKLEQEGVYDIQSSEDPDT
jgi:hypothetical protein